MDKYNFNVSRKGAGDDFSPYDEPKKYFVCEHHFKAVEIRVSLGIGRKTLKPLCHT